MGSDYPSVPLGDVACVRSGFAFKSTDWTESGVPVVKIANVKEGRLVLDGCSFVSPEVAGAAAEFYLRADDILIAMTGYIGEVALVRSSDLPAVLNQRVGRFLIRDGQRLDRRFLFYLLRSPEIRAEIEELGYGSAQPNVSPSLIHRVEVPLPPLPEQRAIAHILGTLDDKIELNRRRNQTLEAMVRALFKDWFVDFGPVRAKCRGEPPCSPLSEQARGPAPTGEYWQWPQHILDLFPDRLDDEGKPEGWRGSTIGNEVTICGGSTPSTKEPAFWNGGKHHWATPKDLSVLRFPVLLDTDRKITNAGIEKISSGLLPVGTVLLSSRAPIGYLAIAEIPTAINQGFIAMKCDGILPNVFVLFWCRKNMDVILGNANGSTFQEISKSNFRPIPVIVPSEPILNVFKEQTMPLYRCIVENERESRTLAQLRDTLLPKLISGELRIADAEKFLENTL